MCFYFERSNIDSYLSLKTKQDLNNIAENLNQCDIKKSTIQTIEFAAIFIKCNCGRQKPRNVLVNDHAKHSIFYIEYSNYI